MGNLCTRPSADQGFADLYVCAEQIQEPAGKQAKAESPQPQQQDAAGAERSSRTLCRADSAGKEWPQPQKQKQSLDVPVEPSDRNRRESDCSLNDSAYSQQGRAFLEWIQSTSDATGQDLSTFILENMAVPSSSSSSSSNACPAATAAPGSFSGDSAFCGSSSSNAQLAGKIQAAAASYGLTPEAVQAAVQAARAASAPGSVKPFRRHDGYALGPPKPPCWDERHATAKAINSLKELRDGEIESMLRLVCHTFEVETATVALLTGECIYLTGACGALPVCVCPDRWGFCGWSFLNPNHELVVVEDMEKDARFSENYFVVSPEFRLVFYCMAPLISSNNNRIGTLCIMGQEPRTFDATRGQLLANLAELVVRQLERNWALRMCAAMSNNSLMRSIACYESAYLFVEVVDDAWRVMHMNPAAIDLLGAKWTASYDDLPKLGDGRLRRPFRGVHMQELFDIHHAGEEWVPGKWEFMLCGVHGALGSAAQAVPFDLHFRLSTSDGLDADQPFFVGVPSWLPAAEDGFGSSSFFVRLEHAAPRTSMDKSRISMDKSRATPPGTPPGSSALSSQQTRRSSDYSNHSAISNQQARRSHDYSGQQARRSSDYSSHGGRQSRRSLGDGSSGGVSASGSRRQSKRSLDINGNGNSASATSGNTASAANGSSSSSSINGNADGVAAQQPQAGGAAASAPGAADAFVVHVKAISAVAAPQHSQNQLRSMRGPAAGAFSALTITDAAAAPAAAAQAASGAGAAKHTAQVRFAEGTGAAGGAAAAAAAATAAPAPAEGTRAAGGAAAAMAAAGAAAAAARAPTAVHKQAQSVSLDLPRSGDRDGEGGLAVPGGALIRQLSAPVTPNTSEPGTPRSSVPGTPGVSSRGGSAGHMAGMVGQAPWAVRGISSAPIEGLLLGPLMGKGSYGRVYRGIYKGAPCAVKIVDNQKSVRKNASGQPLEAALTCGLHHLGVMRTLKFAYADTTDAYGAPSVNTGTSCWMVFEHCNKGCVSDAVVKGWFRTSCRPTQGGTNLRAVVMTAYEVASAMAYLHSQGVTHGDLSGGNVMLQASSINAHGFTAKVGDFGMAREATASLLSRPNAYGTITHMPPEVLLDAKVSPGMDVFAFGVLFWEMLTSSRAWAGLRHAQIVCQVAVMKRQLEAPAGLPEPLLQLLQACLAHNVAERCTFKEAVAVLGDWLQEHKDLDNAQLELPLCCSEPPAAA